MTKDEQEYASVRYVAEPLTIIPLSSGRFAIGSGFNPRDLFIIVEEEEVPSYIRAHQESARREHEEALARAHTVPDFDIDLGDFTL